MKRKDQDIGLGVIIILFASACLTQTMRLSEAVALFPKWLLWLMVASGVLIILRALLRLKKGEEPYHRMTGKEFVLEAGLPGAILVLICCLLETLGFYICSFLILCAVSLLQKWVSTGSLKMPGKEWLKLLAFSLGMTALMYLCFSFLLSLPTPVGVLGI